MKPEATGETRGWCGLDDGAETRWTCVVSRNARGKFWDVVLVRVPPTLCYVRVRIPPVVDSFRWQSRPFFKMYPPLDLLATPHAWLRSFSLPPVLGAGPPPGSGQRRH